MLQRIGRYEILDRIAAGGQGTVYRARDTVLDRVVAVIEEILGGNRLALRKGTMGRKKRRRALHIMLTRLPMESAKIIVESIIHHAIPR